MIQLILRLSQAQNLVAPQIQYQKFQREKGLEQPFVFDISNSFENHYLISIKLFVVSRFEVRLVGMGTRADLDRFGRFGYRENEDGLKKTQQVPEKMIN